jgi:hypothetical protein
MDNRETLLSNLSSSSSTSTTPPTSTNEIKEQEQTTTKAETPQEKQDIDYSKSVRAIAEKGIYEFEYVEGPKAGQKERKERYKISNRMMLELEKDRAEYASLVDRFADGGKAASKGITKEERLQAAKMLTDLYAKLAKYYFHIERDDFDIMDWDSSKPNIDAAANISLRGRPNLV